MTAENQALEIGLKTQKKSENLLSKTACEFFASPTFFCKQLIHFFVCPPHNSFLLSRVTKQVLEKLCLYFPVESRKIPPPFLKLGN